MIKAKLGTRLDATVKAALPFLFVRPVNPNLLTVAGCLVSLVAAAAFSLGWFATGGIGILAGGLFDLVDGDFTGLAWATPAPVRPAADWRR